MQELIAIREAARRLGVSDTAVHKAIKAGRVHIAGRTEKSDRPLLAWPDAQRDWNANTDAGRRTHVGSQGSPRRALDDPRPQGVDATGATARDDEIEDDGGDVLIHGAMTLNEAKTAKAILDARLARIEVEQKSGQLLPVADVKASAFRVGRQIRDTLMNIPDRVAAELAHETDPARVHERLRAEIRLALVVLSQPVAV